KELIALAMQLDDTLVPMGYKIRINDYLGQIRIEPGPRRSAAPARAATPVPATPIPAAPAPAAPKSETPGQAR
ncbi:MAG: hypothetical protein LBK40_00535, partial [Spirochaetaceae bacterium]|nr:hypothetical protein [Spirochaetaceae bacterium]